MLGGDPANPNPEDLLIASRAACHMLWFLHRASDAGIVVRPIRIAMIALVLRSIFSCASSMLSIRFSKACFNHEANDRDPGPESGHSGLR